MNLGTTISLCIAIAGFIGGVIAALVKLGASVGRLMERLESNEKRDKEERDKIGANLSELYGRMNAAECDIRSQATAIHNIEATCSRIESKLDRIIEARGQPCRLYTTF
jgi:chromosome segregation ATPase